MTDFLLKQNEAAKARLKSISFSYTKEIRLTEVNADPFDDKVIGTVVESDGRKFWMTDAKHRVQGPSGAALPVRRVDTRMVLNENYLATWRNSPYDIVEQLDHASLATIPIDSRMRIRDVGEDVLQYAFGTREMTLVDIYRQSKNVGRWTVEQLPPGRDGRRFRVVHYWVPGAGHQEWVMQTWDLNADTGFLCELRSYIEADKLAEEHTVLAQQMADGTWVPQQIEYRQYRAMVVRAKKAETGLKDELNFSSKITLSNIVVNPPVPDDQFRLARLGAPDGRMLAHKQLDGRTVTEYLWSGVGVPEAVNDSFVRARQRLPSSDHANSTLRRVELLSGTLALAIAVCWVGWIRARRIRRAGPLNRSP